LVLRGRDVVTTKDLYRTVASLSMDKIETKVATLKEKCLGALTEKQAEGLKDQPCDFSFL
jgi:hypothetical protein